MSKNYLVALVLVCHGVLVQSSMSPRQQVRDMAKSVQEIELGLSNTFNPLLDKRYNPEELSNKARAILDILEPELAAALASFKCEKIGHYSCDLDQKRLANLLRDYQNGSTDKYDSYALYVVTWMQLKPALWEQLEERERELGISSWLAGKMQHPTLRYLRKQVRQAELTPSK